MPDSQGILCIFLAISGEISHNGCMEKAAGSVK